MNPCNSDQDEVCGFTEPCDNSDDDCPDGGCELVCVLPPHLDDEGNYVGQHSIVQLDALDYAIADFYSAPARPVEER